MFKFFLTIIYKLKEIYNKISNRFLAIIILFIIIFFGFYFIKNNFVKNTSNLIIKSNINNYEIFLSKNILKNFEQKKFCKQKICEIKNIVPMDYKLYITKKGYKDIVKIIKIPKNKNFEIKIKLIKKISLEKTNLTKKIKLTRAEKVKILKARLNNNKILKIGQNDFLKEKIIGKNIFIYLNDRLLISFEKTEKEVLFDKIFGQKNEIYIFSGNKIFILNLINKNLINFNFKIEPKYIKKLAGNYLIVTEKGSFIYNVSKNNIQYFYLFKDFVNYKNNLIGIIYSDEINKKKNLGLQNFKQNLIIKYDFKTKQKNIIYKTDKNIEKIFVKNSKIYIIYGGETFLLNNL